MLKKLEACGKNLSNSCRNSEIFLWQVFSYLPQAFNELLSQTWIKLGASRKKHIFSYVKHTFFRLALSLFRIAATICLVLVASRKKLAARKFQSCRKNLTNSCRKPQFSSAYSNFSMSVDIRTLQYSSRRWCIDYWSSKWYSYFTFNNPLFISKMRA